MFEFLMPDFSYQLCYQSAFTSDTTFDISFSWKSGLYKTSEQKNLTENSE